MHSALFKFIVLILANIRHASPAALIERAGSPSIVNGNINAPLKPAFYFNQLGAKIKRIEYENNYIMSIGNVNCENEEYAEVFAHMVNTVVGKSYNVSFRYLFTATTNHVSWDLDYFQHGPCHGCSVFFLKNEQYARVATAGVWYTWSGVLTKPQELANKDITLEVDMDTRGYRGVTYVDDFLLEAI